MASLEALAEVHARHGHIQEVILQNFVPHPRYHGQEVAEIADRRRPGSAGAGTAEPCDAATRRCPSGRTRSRSTT